MKIFYFKIKKSCIWLKNLTYLRSHLLLKWYYRLVVINLNILIIGMKYKLQSTNILIQSTVKEILDKQDCILTQEFNS